MGAAAAERRAGPDGGGGDGQRHDDGGNQLETLRRDVGAQGQRDDEAVDDTACHSRRGLGPHAATAKQRLANDEGRQADDHHAGAQVDVGRFLVLGQYGAGKGRHGVGNAQANRDGERRVDGGGTHHVGVIAGGADGKAHPGAQEQDQQQADDHGDDRGHQQLVREHIAKKRLRHCKDGLRFQHWHVGGKAHNRQVDGVQPRVGDDAGEDRRHAQAGLQSGCDKAGSRTGGNSQKQTQHRVPGHRGGSRDRAPQGKGAVGTHIGDI